MTDDLQNKTINVVKIEPTATNVKVTDQDGIQYSFFRNKQDGSISKAQETFNNLGVKLNDVMDIGFKINGNYKNITIFKTPTNQAAESVAPFVTPAEVKDKQDVVAAGKVRHGFAIEAYKMGKGLTPATVTGIDKWVEYVMTGKLIMPEEE